MLKQVGYVDENIYLISLNNEENSEIQNTDEDNHLSKSNIQTPPPLKTESKLEFDFADDDNTPKRFV